MSSPPRPMGRPPKPIDWEVVEGKVAAGCNSVEIAQDFRIDTDTFYRRFIAEYGETFTSFAARQSMSGEANLKYQQYQKALGLTKKGDTALLIHLGKVRLKQKEYEDKSTVPNDETLELKDQLTKALFRIEELENALKPKTDSLVQ